MRAPAILAVLSLVACQAPTWGGAADVLTPDEFTLGSGSTTSGLDGKIDARGDDSWPSTYDGESESTYAALTWDLPTWEGKEGGMDREAQRNMALLLDKMVADEIGVVDPQGDPVTKLDKLEFPPLWLLIGVGLVLVFLVLAAMKKSRRSSWR